jgi:pyruvate/2-oxoglutarate dehydrogenase complex dihydrolipoamide acyltransferase (E2) component
MIYKISVPPVAEVEEIRVLEWQGSVGHKFNAGDLVVELETHKAIVEVRAAQPGYLRQVLSAAGEWQEIGLPLAILSDEADEALPAADETLADLAVEFSIT